MTAADFRADHGDPMGDDTHPAWTPGDWDVWDHLHSLGRDRVRDKTGEADYALIAANRHKPHALPDEMTVRVIWRSGWSMAIRTVTISAFCPVCGGRRGEPKNHNFHEDGDWFSCDRWTNPCGHVDMYTAVLAEAAARWMQITGRRWDRTVDGVAWTLLLVGDCWVLDQPAYPDGDQMGTGDIAVAQERANEQIAAWHKHHPRPAEAAE